MGSEFLQGIMMNLFWITGICAMLFCIYIIVVDGIAERILNKDEVDIDADIILIDSEKIQKLLDECIEEEKNCKNK